MRCALILVNSSIKALEKVNFSFLVIFVSLGDNIELLIDVEQTSQTFQEQWGHLKSQCKRKEC